ncbi:protein toll [Caerostris darwini]|uniref:Protein toll n=1 Tax=Caerostris darwini TaxID=1538125 RepID=A0AAV4UF10_9ARAC|nr:protein toll [Caerostris darwini]
MSAYGEEKSGGLAQKLSRAGRQRHQVRIGRDGGSRLVPHGFRPLPGQPRPLRHTRFRGSWFPLVGGRREDRLDAVPDAREGVALLARGALRQGGDREFDAFSHMDQDVVIPELIQQIEARDPGVRLFIHYKHFLPGELIQLNIVRAIQVSKRTVLVLSRSFLDSEWCMFEFRVVHVEALKNRLNRIIIIKMGDLPEDKELPEEIQVYLKSTTYLTWGKSTFGTPCSTPFPDLST